jgi:hypothetical protein
MKFSPSRAQSTLSLAAEGEPRIWVARNSGISLRTLQSWLAKGRDGDPSYARWADEFIEAERLAYKRKIDARHEREREKSRQRWQTFKRSRERWWLEHLGPARFWQNRLDWLASEGHRDAYRQTVALLRKQGFLH